MENGRYLFQQRAYKFIHISDIYLVYNSNDIYNIRTYTHHTHTCARACTQALSLSLSFSQSSGVKFFIAPWCSLQLILHYVLLYHSKEVARLLTLYYERLLASEEKWKVSAHRICFTIRYKFCPFNRISVRSPSFCYYYIGEKRKCENRLKRFWFKIQLSSVSEPETFSTVP